MNQEDLQQRILTVVSYVLDDDYTKIERRIRATMQPARIAFVIASYDPMVVGGEELYKVDVMYDDTTGLELFLRSLDLSVLETAVGTYFTSM